ncbi:hypothetical protein [Dyadobacter sp. CY312]|uniref:hypothetical protein n=1 Tax=Dyadobacter sp. CY312 TaxID=2907303 RepID=UPI001F447A99|nr:hypothetical protein [Dyadobacter sp. CY312]MCE7039184.1 hypothetical protein [Dyadobacter sp. CY312]
MLQSTHTTSAPAAPIAKTRKPRAKAPRKMNRWGKLHFELDQAEVKEMQVDRLNEILNGFFDGYGSNSLQSIEVVVNSIPPADMDQFTLNHALIVSKIGLFLAQLHENWNKLNS